MFFEVHGPEDGSVYHRGHKLPLGMLETPTKALSSIRVLGFRSVTGCGHDAPGGVCVKGKAGSGKVLSTEST